MEMTWSRWFRCESSFGLLLVPSQPGVFALAEEIVEPAGDAVCRQLAVFEIDESEDLVRSLSRLFTAVSPWRDRLASIRCYMRYSVIPGRQERSVAVMALRNWLESQRDSATRLFESEAATVAERTVDRVTRSMSAKEAPAG